LSAKRSDRLWHLTCCSASLSASSAALQAAEARATEDCPTARRLEMSKRKQHAPNFKAKVALEALKGEQTAATLASR